MCLCLSQVDLVFLWYVRFYVQPWRDRSSGLKEHGGAAEGVRRLRVNDRTPVSLIVFPLTAVVNYSPGLCCRDELRGSGIKALEEEDEIIKS